MAGHDGVVDEVRDRICLHHFVADTGLDVVYEASAALVVAVEAFGDH